MFSSDMRIIKDAKISRDPVVIEMHEFQELNLSELVIDESSSKYPAGAAATEKGPGTLKNSMPGSQESTIEPSPELTFQEAKVQSEMLLSATAQEIIRMKALAEDGAEGLRSQAVEEGVRKGQEEARRQMAHQLQQTTERCNALLDAATREARQIVLGSENQIVELVMAISRKIICDEMEERSDIILEIVKKALERVRDQSRINIHVSLDDYERILQARRELQGIVGAEQNIMVTADAVLEQGGCLIETSFGTVEAGVDTQLDSIRRALQEMLP